MSITQTPLEDQTKSFLFTVDVEDWFQVENFKATIPFETWGQQQLRVETNTHRILDLFDAASLDPSAKLTFFILGWIARQLPGLVREIHNRGHEVASHGDKHRLCTSESTQSLRADLADSKNLLEAIIGDPVFGYRAPSFSISNEVLKIIEDTGYLYDSSLNSFDRHGRYGRLSTNSFSKKGIAYKLSDNFYELPISNLKVNDWILPLGGGGYFRLFPYSLFKAGIRRILAHDDAYSFYFHPWEIDQSQPRVEDAPKALKFRHYVNLKSTQKKLVRMLTDFSHCRFITCSSYLEKCANFC